jgi:hypothetical protein
MIKGWDLISAKGYLQSNHGHRRSSGWPTMPDRMAVARCGRHGRSSPELCTTQQWCSVFWWFIFLRNRWGARNSPIGSSSSGGHQSRMWGSKVHASTFGDGGGGGHSNGRLTTRMGKTGAAQDLEHRRWVDGAWDASYATWWWKGWT